MNEVNQKLDDVNRAARMIRYDIEDLQLHLYDVTRDTLKTLKEIHETLKILVNENETR